MFGTPVGAYCGGSSIRLSIAVAQQAPPLPSTAQRVRYAKLVGVIPDNMTLDELRADIVSEVARLGHVLDLPVVREPQGIENWPSPGPTNGEGEAE